MQINNSRQQILQAYAKARQTTYRHLSIVAAVLLDLAIFQIPSKPFLQKFGIDNAFHTGIENLFQPFSWQPVAGWHPLQVIIYYGVVSLVLESLYLPVAFHIEYTLPRRFKLGVKTARKTLLNILKKQGQLVVRWAVLIEIAYLLLALQPLFWWFEMALLLSLIMTIKQWRGPSTIRRLFTVTSLPEGELRQRLQTLLARFSIPEPHIAAVDQPGTRIAANAWITGYGKSRLIGFSSTMLKEFSQDEIVVLFAHELGHYVHGDHWRKPVVRLGIRLLEYGLIALILAAATATSTGGDITTVPLFVLVNLLSWLYGTITFYRFSRHCEYEADEFALQATGLATAFEQAMIRIANINRVVAHPERESATHPSLVSRIKHAQEFARRNQEMPAENVLQT